MKYEIKNKYGVIECFVEKNTTKPYRANVKYAFYVGASCTNEGTPAPKFDGNLERKIIKELKENDVSNVSEVVKEMKQKVISYVPPEIARQLNSKKKSVRSRK